MLPSVNFWCSLQMKIMRERESRCKRRLLMKYTMLRRRQNQTLFLTICLSLISLYRKEKVKQNRWVRRSYGCFQKVWNTCDNERIKSCFQMSTETFFNLNWIGPHDTTAKDRILLQQRLAICLYILSRGDYYHTITGLINVQCIWNEFVTFPETVDQILTAISQMEHK